MTDTKPPEISDYEWTQTPPTVKALLAQSLERIKQIEHLRPETAVENPPANGDGATIALPSEPSADSEGATIALPSEPSPADGEGATIALSSEQPSADSEGATIALPSDQSPDGSDGATVALTSELSSIDSDGDTVALPSDDEGVTLAVSFGDTALITAGATFHSSSQPVANDRHLSTFNLRPDQNANRDGAAHLPRHPGPPPTQGKVTQALTIPSLDEDNQSIERREIILQERYQLRQILGKGGFGAAYLAEDLKLKRGCVVKQMLSPQHISPRELEQKRLDFEREASLLVHLNQPGHPNIPEIFDYFSNENGSYLVMKYIQGQSLQDALKSQAGPTQWRDAVRYVIDVCSALNYMHTQGEQPVMHRDIKPGNILLGDDGRIWLVDFGLAKTKPVNNAADLEEVKSAGSAGYTPFEQWLGQAVPASDIYAVGVTLHHLVTGVSPLEAFRDNGEIKINIVRLQDLHSRLEPIRKINRDLPRELDEIIAGATAAEPEQRPTALQLQQQLEVLIAGAKNAALFTFRSGQSARTVGELVDQCEQNRGEAQGYLYRGDFERWFTLINRNDLAAAATMAVKHGEQKGKDGLEKFLKLIMPNLFWRRMGRATLRVAKAATLFLLIAVLVGAALTISGTLATSWLLQQTIANRDWNYYALDVDQDNLFSEADLTGSAQEVTKAYLSDIQISPQSPDQLAVQTTLSGSWLLDFPVTLTLNETIPHVELTTVNGFSLGWVGRTLSEGINTGIEQALVKAPVAVTSLAVTDGAVVVDVRKRRRVAWNPPTPDPVLVPTRTPIPSPTPTPPGLALLAIFNELDQAVILEIGGQSWPIPAHDTKVIEQAPGSYRYTLRYAVNGQVAAEGYRDWTYKAYRWRITTNGNFIE
ncbi:MAG: protein kinase [Anaerolineae bacterium]|nr:protein kinase [Anaerolineae bacterium]